MTVDDRLAYLTKGCVDVVRAGELRAKIERAARSGAPLVVKVGFDPTAPDLHLGHTVLIRKMKHFQDLGHRVVFLIGDFTGLIGDPTGRSKTRPPLTREEIDANAETYKAQVFKLLDPEKTVVDFNSRWLGPLGSEGWIRLAARYNVAQMLERRDFKQRYTSGQPIAIHELLYPLAQAYDSVALKADVELGGTDQLFNLNVGRDIMPAFGLEAQVVMTTPLLEGLDGVEKMSKSLNNYVGVTEPPDEMFGKLMSISDELMWKYYTLLTDVSEAGIAKMRRESSDQPTGMGPALRGLRKHLGLRDPDDQTASMRGLRRAIQMECKFALAERIVVDFHGQNAAASARRNFEHRVVWKELPADLPVVEYRIDMVVPRTLERVLADKGFAESGSDAARKIKQGAVKVNGQRFTVPQWHLTSPGEYIVEVGRRAFKLRVIADS
jgi:tyrosyl-tRNA synthetase